MLLVLKLLYNINKICCNEFENYQYIYNPNRLYIDLGESLVTYGNRFKYDIKPLYNNYKIIKYPEGVRQDASRIEPMIIDKYINNLLLNIKKFAELTRNTDPSYNKRRKFFDIILELYFLHFHKNKDFVRIAMELTRIFYYIFLTDKGLNRMSYLGIGEEKIKKIFKGVEKFLSDNKEELDANGTYTMLKESYGSNKVLPILENLYYMHNEIMMNEIEIINKHKLEVPFRLSNVFSADATELKHEVSKWNIIIEIFFDICVIMNIKMDIARRFIDSTLIGHHIHPQIFEYNNRIVSFRDTSRRHGHLRS